MNQIATHINSGLFIEVKKFKRLLRNDGLKLNNLTEKVTFGEKYVWKKFPSFNQLLIKEVYAIIQLFKYDLYKLKVFIYLNEKNSFIITSKGRYDMFDLSHKSYLRNMHSLDRKYKILSNAAESLYNLHSLKICHLDVKVENYVLLSKKPELEIIDFDTIRVDPGVTYTAITMEDLIDRTVCPTQHIIRNTVPFIAPEILFGYHLACSRSDIWSLAMVIIEYLYDWGWSPISKYDDLVEEYYSDADKNIKNNLNALFQIINRDYAKIVKDDDLISLLDRCFSLNPIDRPEAVDVLKFFNSKVGKKIELKPMKFYKYHGFLPIEHLSPVIEIVSYWQEVEIKQRVVNYQYMHWMKYYQFIYAILNKKISKEVRKASELISFFLVMGNQEPRMLKVKDNLFDYLKLL